MSLKEILETNARFVAENRCEPMPLAPRKKWAVVSCMDFRLTEFLEQALGIHRGDAVMIRNAGNTRTPEDSSVLRSLVAAVLLFEIKEVLVIGHSNCGMRMSVMQAMERMRERGIPREAFGSRDLRESLGLIPDEAENVRQVVAEITASPLIPKGIPVLGFVIDVETGKLCYVGGRLPAGEARPPEAPAPAPSRPAATASDGPSRGIPERPPAPRPPASVTTTVARVAEHWVERGLRTLQSLLDTGDGTRKPPGGRTRRGSDGE